MVTFVDPQEADLELHAVDCLVDVVRQTRVEDVVVVAAQLLGFLRGDRDVAESACAGDESASGNVQRKRRGAGGGVDLLRQPVRSGEPQEALDPAQLGLIVGALDGRDAVVGDPAADLVEGRMVIEVPTQRYDVLRRAPSQ